MEEAVKLKAMWVFPVAYCLHPWTSAKSLPYSLIAVGLCRRAVGPGFAGHRLMCEFPDATLSYARQPGILRTHIIFFFGSSSFSSSFSSFYFKYCCALRFLVVLWLL